MVELFAHIEVVLLSHPADTSLLRYSKSGIRQVTSGLSANPAWAEFNPSSTEQKVGGPFRLIWRLQVVDRGPTSSLHRSRLSTGTNQTDRLLPDLRAA